MSTLLNYCCHHHSSVTKINSATMNGIIVDFTDECHQQLFIINEH